MVIARTEAWEYLDLDANILDARQLAQRLHEVAGLDAAPRSFWVHDELQCQTVK